MNIGYIGWRGMVGSVLFDRMIEEDDFSGATSSFFSTSNVGGFGPDLGAGPIPLLDAKDSKALSQCDVLVSCQGGAYTEELYPKLRSAGWKGYWIDAASTLRMSEQSVIVLDPVNGHVIKDALARGCLDFVGGNCTVSLMLMALAGLFRENLVEWLSSMTYQAASGAGAAAMNELVNQCREVLTSEQVIAANAKPGASAVALERALTQELRSGAFSTEALGAPIAFSALPFIDKLVAHGQSREEWKGQAETNKILQTSALIPIDGLCVRIGALRCHSQGFTIKLRKDVSLATCEALIAEAHEWVTLVPNTKEDSLNFLTPTAVSGTLNTPVGRVRKMSIGSHYLTAFTVGDQLLWGAAEPLRRVLRLIREYRE